MRNSNKDLFLENPKNEHEMAAKELPSIIKHYQDKFDIKIILNGSTEYGKKILEEIEKSNQKLIDSYNDNSQKYVLYLQKYWRNYRFFRVEDFAISSNKQSVFFEKYEELEQKIKPYLDEDQNIRSNLNAAELKELNDICSAPEFKNLFDSQIEKLQKNIAENDGCLTRDQTIEEITKIQESLKENELVGYFYTNNHRVEADHFEVIILSKDNIIKPIEWNADIFKQVSLSYRHRKQLASSDIKDFVDSIKQQTAPIRMMTRVFTRAQAQKTAVCGTLGMLYLKELLKDNGKQIKESSLIIPYYDKYDGLKHFFFHSPHVLKYSHSNSYNEIMKAMLSDTTEPVVLVHKDTTHTITTIKATLEKTKKTALENNDAQTAEECTKLLESLPEFRTKWMDEYQKAIQKRDSMQHKEVNQYLNYKSNRLFSKSLQSIVSNENSAQDDSKIQNKNFSSKK